MGKTFQDFVAEAREQVPEVTIDEVKSKLDHGDHMVLVDVREDSEWEKGHVPRAVHCSRGVLEMRAPGEIDSSGTEVICYCGGGSRSLLAAKVLKDMGYPNVKSMAGGFSGWAGAGYSVEN